MAGTLVRIHRVTVVADGTEVEAIWAYLAESDRAMLVTVYFPD